MAKKRDYQAEERRRNEIARERGFTSRAQQRTKVKKGLVSGKPLGPAAPTFIRKGFASQKEYDKSRRQPPIYARAGFTTQKELNAARREAVEWSRRHSHKTVSEYRPTGLHADPIAFRAYYNAFINPDTAVSVIGKRRRAIENGALTGEFDGGKPPVRDDGLNALQAYLLDFEDYTEAEVYDAPY